MQGELRIRWEMYISPSNRVHLDRLGLVSLLVRYSPGFFWFPLQIFSATACIVGERDLFGAGVHKVLGNGFYCGGFNTDGYVTVSFLCVGKRIVCMLLCAIGVLGIISNEGLVNYDLVVDDWRGSSGFTGGELFIGILSLQGCPSGRVRTFLVRFAIHLPVCTGWCTCPTVSGGLLPLRGSCCPASRGRCLRCQTPWFRRCDGCRPSLLACSFIVFKMHWFSDVLLMVPFKLHFLRRCGGRLHGWLRSSATRETGVSYKGLNVTFFFNFVFLRWVVNYQFY